MNITLLSYSAIDGIPTMADSEVMGLYDQMEKDGSAEEVFCEYSDMSAEIFLNMMKNGNQLFVVSINNEVSGVIWLNSFETKRASFHFCFFSNAWKHDLVEASKKCFTYLLNMKNKSGDYIFDVFTGIIPSTNERANKWAKRIDAAILGVLPHASWIHKLQKSVPGTVYYVERGRYG